jgi:hypothetical protein
MSKWAIVLFAMILTAGTTFADQIIPLGLRPGEKIVACNGESDGRGNFVFAITVKVGPPQKNKQLYYLYTRSGRRGPFSEFPWLALSPDGRTVASSVTLSDGKYVICGDATFGPFQDVAEIGFAPRSGAFYYAYKEKFAWYLSLGGTTFGPFGLSQEILYPIRFSSDGTSFAFRDAQSGIVLNGKKWRGYEDIDWIWFPAEGNEPYSIAKENGQWFFFENRDKFGPFTKVYLQYFFHDGRHPLCQVWDNAGTYLFDGKNTTGPFSEIGNFGPVNDAGEFWYTAKKTDGWFLCTPAQEFGPYEKILSVACTFNSGGFIYAIRENGQFFYFWKGQKYGPMAEISVVKVSYTGDWISYGYKEGDGWRLKFDDKTYGPFKKLEYVLVIGKYKVLAFIEESNIEYPGFRIIADGEVLPGGLFFGENRGYYIIKNGNLILRE